MHISIFIYIQMLFGMNEGWDYEIYTRIVTQSLFIGNSWPPSLSIKTLLSTDYQLHDPLVHANGTKVSGRTLRHIDGNSRDDNLHNLGYNLYNCMEIF